jgi:hypothetical protein
VAKDAELCVEGLVPITVPKIVVDAAGMGVLKGFKLAEGGAIDIVNLPEGAEKCEIAADFSEVELPTDYTFTIGGAATDLLVKFNASKTAIRVMSRGMLFMVK